MVPAWWTAALLGCHPAPEVTTPGLSTLDGVAVVITGSGFGDPGPRAGLYVDGTVALASELATSWTDDRIEAALPAGTASGDLTVRVGGRSSEPVPFEAFRYEDFAIPDTPGTNAAPLAVALDDQGRLWIDQEFHLDLQVLDTATGAVTAIPIPHPPDPGPFAQAVFGESRTQISSSGEDVIVHPDGAVWLTEGGGYLYEGDLPNHSRVLRYEPSTGTFRVYNLPGDHNEVVGVAWDPTRARIWAVQGSLEVGGALWGFDPDVAPWDDAFDFSTSLDGWIDDPDGFSFDPLPSLNAPAHVVVDADGALWITGYWSNAMARYLPDTGHLDVLPLPPATSGTPFGDLFGGGPWFAAVLPDGDVTFTEFFDGAVSRVDAARVRAGDAACTAVVDGANPCVTTLTVPEWDPATERVHSLAVGPDGRVWFTIHPDDPEQGRASVGFVTADGARIVRLPPLPREDGEPAQAAAGIAVGPGGDLWFAEYWRHRIGHLAPL